MVDAARLLAKSLAKRISLFSSRVYSKPSYSQEGEDRLLDRYFGNRANGFFVDVGAHHPHRFSNTYLFYKRGWRGINIDAMPDSMKAFKSMRPRDVEGRDLDVLKSNDWQRYRPEIILVESITGDLDSIASDASAQFLNSAGYRIYAKTVYTCFYVQDKTTAQ